jgi:hypothetical protein
MYSDQVLLLYPIASETHIQLHWIFHKNGGTSKNKPSVRHRYKYFYIRAI